MDRGGFRRAVLHAVTRVRPDVRVRGSFHYDDHHYDGHIGRTLSDLDAVLVGADEPERDEAQTRLVDEISRTTGQRVRVSIHPERNFELLSLKDARFLAVGEFLRHAPTGDHDTAFGAFLRAKTALLCARSAVGQRYRAVAMELGTPAAQRALCLKLGCCTPGFTSTDLLALAAPVLAQEGALVERCLTESGVSENRAQYRSALLTRSGVNTWLREYLARKIT